MTKKQETMVILAAREKAQRIHNGFMTETYGPKFSREEDMAYHNGYMACIDMILHTLNAEHLRSAIWSKE